MAEFLVVCLDTPVLAQSIILNRVDDPSCSDGKKLARIQEWLLPKLPAPSPLCEWLIEFRLDLVPGDWLGAVPVP